MDGTLTGGMSPFLAEAPGGDTLLDLLVHGELVLETREMELLYVGKCLLRPSFLIIMVFL